MPFPSPTLCPAATLFPGGISIVIAPLPSGITIVIYRPELFPTGTIVSAYPANAWRSEGGMPAGPSLETRVVDATEHATFILLRAETPYLFAALVNGQPRLLQQRSSHWLGPKPTWQQKVAARRAAAGTS